MACRALRCESLGAPWNSLEHTLNRVYFAQGHRDEDAERVVHLVFNLHALHRERVDRRELLEAAIGQTYKACGKGNARLWAVIPDPQPSTLHGRTLAHPSEDAAGILNQGYQKD